MPDLTIITFDRAIEDAVDTIVLERLIPAPHREDWFAIGDQAHLVRGTMWKFDPESGSVELHIKLRR